MVDGFSPMARKLLSTDPISAFRDLRDVVHHVLRMVDVLGIYRGKRAPTAQHRRLARGLVSELNVRFLARQLSAARLRDFQCASYLLQLSKEATPRKFRATVSAMDWQLVGETIGDQWKDLPHDAEVLLHVGASVPACQAEIARVVMNNVQRIESFPPRLVLFAPEAAVKHVQGEGAIRLAHHGHVAWYFGVPVLAWFYENHRDLLVPLLKPSLAATARSLSEADPSWYRKAAPYIELLGKTAPRLPSACLGWRCRRRSRKRLVGLSSSRWRSSASRCSACCFEPEPSGWTGRSGAGTAKEVSEVICAPRLQPQLTRTVVESDQA